MARGRASCCQRVGLNKGLWTLEEDKRLIAHINKNSYRNWRALAKQIACKSSNIACIGFLRCGNSCHLRWINYLFPDIKRGNFSKEKEETIINLHELLGNNLPGRTDNEIKNMWNTHLKKRLKIESPTPQPSVVMIKSHENVSLSNDSSTSSSADKELSFLDNMNLPWDMFDDSSMLAQQSLLTMEDNANNTPEIAPMRSSRGCK